MVKDVFYSQVRGRRATDQPEQIKYKFDWWKLMLVPVIGGIFWIISHGFMAEKNKETLDLQVTVLHQRIEAQEQIHRVDDQKIRAWILDKMLELQKEIYTSDRPNLNRNQEAGR